MSTTDALDAGLPATSESEEVKGTEQNTTDLTAQDGGVEEKAQEEKQETKTFTQAEVDALIQKRLLKAERRFSKQIEQTLREQQTARTLEEPKREAFVDEQEFFKAQVEHLAEKRAAEKMAEREERERREKMSETFLERSEKAIERYPDFNDVVSNPTLAINTDMAEFIAESEHGPDIAYHLGKNPALAARIANMSPIKAARELTSIELELASKPKTKQPSKAPEPITPVGTRGRASSSSLPSDEDDIGTWMRKERERAQKRR